MGAGVSADGLRLLRLIGDTPGFMREMSVAEQRYEAVRAVIADGETVTLRGGAVRYRAQDVACVAGQVRG
jgi:hypothetical protein